MARMIPEYINPDCKSRAERKLFDRLKTEVDDNHVVLHSLGLAKHRAKLYSDIDFAILSRRGLLALEIKGGRIERNRGRWYFTNRYGESTSKSESPMSQAKDGMYALRTAVRNKFGDSSSQAKTV